MKSKKLFAILTLVAFMMTLVPAMAFGYSASATLVSYDKTEVGTSDATTDRPIKITMTFRTSSGAADGTVNMVYLKSDNDAVKVAVAEAGTNTAAAGDIATGAELGLTGVTGGVYAVGGNIAGGDGVKLGLAPNGATGRVTLYVYSVIGGTAKLSFYNNAPATSSNEVLIDEKTVTFNASDASAVDSVLSLTSGATEPTKAGQTWKLTTFVYDATHNGIQGKNVEYFIKEGSAGAWVSIGSATTDEFGEAKIEKAYTKSGLVNFKAKVEGLTEEQVYSTTGVTLKAADPVAIAYKTENKYAEKAAATKLEFFVTDIYGNKCDNNYEDKVVYSITAAPSDAGLTLPYSIDNDAAEDYHETNKTVYLSYTFNTAGEYKVKAAIKDTGLSSTMTVNVAKFGTVKSIKVELPDDKPGLKTKSGDELVRNGANTVLLDVTEVDENGIEKAVTSFGDYVFSTSNFALLGFLDASVENKVYGPVDGGKGVATITVTNTAKNMVATLDIPVLGSENQIKETVTYADKVATVKFQVADSTGAATFYGTGASDTDYSVITSQTVSEKNLIDDQKGSATFKVTAADYGKYPVTIVLPNGIAKQVELNFVKAQEKIGAKSVTMFIGAKGFVQDGAAKVADVAPFLKDNRTFVEVRSLATAFGAEVGWNEATNTVTLTRSDMTVTIVIGGAVTKTVGGVSSAVASDVPAFITAEGRTVLPFRAVGEAFGATVSYDAATQAVSFTQ